MATTLIPTPTEEQAMLLDASARFMEAAHPMTTVRAVADGADRDDAAYRRQAAELGWFGLLAAEEDGGGSISGNGILDAALIATERGARLQPGPYVGHSAVVAALSATPDGHQAMLQALVDGREWATWAAGPGCSLRSGPDGLRLEGAVEPIAEIAGAGHLLLTVDGPDGTTQVLLPLDRAGVTIVPLQGLDVTRTWGRVELHAVAVGPADLVGEPGPATDALVARQRQVAAVLLAAESIGAMSADFDLALAYAKDRVAFGRPIGSFQALKHLLADASLWVEMSKALVTDAATALGGEAADGPELAHAARSFVAEHSTEVAQTCFQVFGGIGFTWEHDQHLYLRRLSADAAMFGSAADHRRHMLDVMGALR